MITFYADWCPHCKTFETELASALSDPSLADKRIKFGAVDVMANRDLTSKFGIKRSPTVKIFGNDKFAPIDYTGQRKSADVVSYCGEYCLENNFWNEPVIEYKYNVQGVIGEISNAFDARVAAAEASHAENLKEIIAQYQVDVTGLEANYE